MVTVDVVFEILKYFRGFALSTLKSLGFGKKETEDIIMKERDVMIDYLGQQQQPVLMNHFFHIPIFNIQWKLMAGSRFTNRVKWQTLKFF